MNEDYIFNVVQRIGAEKSPDKADYVRYDEVLAAVREDIQLALNELVSQKKLEFSKTVNGGLLFRAYGGVD